MDFLSLFDAFLDVSQKIYIFVGRMKNEGFIEVIGAREHNLKNIDVRIPRGSLTVITGLSGSGKSSLAFDTIFAEGQRRYLDTFSSYARGYIGTMRRPDVDRITGLSPVIAIDQKTTSRNPRSTVGTVTEVYDYLRLLYARAGVAHSWISGAPMVKLTDEEIISILQREYGDKKIMILSPLVNNRKGHYKELFDSMRKKGYVYVRVDGELRELVQGMKVDRYSNHSIELVVDRFKGVMSQGAGIKTEQSDQSEDPDLHRLRASVDKAMSMGEGVMMVLDGDSGSVRYFSRNLMDAENGLSYRDPAPHSFSFNSPSGWCPCCRGLGYIDATADGSDQSDESDEFDLSDGSDKTDKSDKSERQECPECHGLRLNKESLSYRFGDKNIAELTAMDIDELVGWLSNKAKRAKKSDGSATADKSDKSEISNKAEKIAEPIIKEIMTRLEFMRSVGLGYLSLSRSSETLSGGESQRIRLATQIGSRLVNVLYILDEPSIGLHQRDNERLIASLKELRDMGNTVIVVEHDEQIMREADYIVDIGPKAGRLGGELMYAGPPKLSDESDESDKSDRSDRSDGSDKSDEIITLHGCRGNNLRNIDVTFPLRKMIGVTGVSGSGKSSLVNNTLYPILSQRFYRSRTQPLPYDRIEGVEQIDKVIAVDQSPIGRSSRSNPATYTDVFGDIRDLFASLPESKIRGWKAGRFSFNSKGGRCEECEGYGYKTIRMHFLPDVYAPCEACGGLRYNRETLEVRFKGKTIADVLDMTINQAVEFFEAQPYILRKIKTIQDVGLGYIKLGQPSTTLSGGESQRIKLAAELSRPSTGRTLYILDEPTTGLHKEDIRVLMSVLRKLVDKGNTVLIIEHNLDVIRDCDYLIDMGPEGGRNGGNVVACGTMDEIKHCPQSLTGRYL